MEWIVLYHIHREQNTRLSREERRRQTCREAEVIMYMTGVELGVKIRKLAPDIFSFLIPGLEETQLPILL